MKNSTNEGDDQHYNVQAAADQDSLLIVAHALSNHPNDKQEVAPTLDALSPAIGRPGAAASDNGYFSEANIVACQSEGSNPTLPPDANRIIWIGILISKSNPNHPLQTPVQSEDGSSAPDRNRPDGLSLAQIYHRAGHWDHQGSAGIPPVSPRGLKAAAGEWGLVCRAFNLKRLHNLFEGASLL